MCHSISKIEAGKMKLTSLGEVKAFLKLTYINMPEKSKGLKGI